MRTEVNPTLLVLAHEELGPGDTDPNDDQEHRRAKCQRRTWPYRSPGNLCALQSTVLGNERGFYRGTKGMKLCSGTDAKKDIRDLPDDSSHPDVNTIPTAIIQISVDCF